MFRSGGVHSRRSLRSRNAGSSMYAFDTFSSEDENSKRSGHSDDRSHHSSSVLSQTSSISLPMSKGNETDRSLGKMSDPSQRSLETRQTTRSLPEVSVRSNPSRHQKSNRSHSEVNRPQSENQLRSSKSSLRDKSPSQSASLKRRQGNESRGSVHRGRESQQDIASASSHQEINNSVHSSLMDSVGLQRYQPDESTTTMKESWEKTEDGGGGVGGSRPHTQVMVIPLLLKFSSEDNDELLTCPSAQ